MFNEKFSVRASDINGNCFGVIKREGNPWSVVHVASAEFYLPMVEVSGRFCFPLKVTDECAVCYEGVADFVATLPEKDEILKNVGRKEIGKSTVFASTPGAIDEVIKISLLVNTREKDYREIKNLIWIDPECILGTLRALQERGIIFDSRALAGIGELVGIKKQSPVADEFITKQIDGLDLSQHKKQPILLENCNTKFLQAKKIGNRIYAHRPNLIRATGEIVNQDVVIIAPFVEIDGAFYVVINKEKRPPLTDVEVGRENVRAIAFPAGLVDLEDGENMEAAQIKGAARELWEETGIVAEKSLLLNKCMASSPKNCSEHFAAVLTFGKFSLSDKKFITDDKGIIHLVPQNSDGGITEENIFIPLALFDEYLSNQPENCLVCAQTNAVLQIIKAAGGIGCFF